MGKFNGVLSRKVNKLAKELEYDLPKDADPLDLLDAIAEPVLGLKGQVTSWKEKAEKNIADDVLKEWEKKVKLVEKERDLFRGQAQEFGKKYEDLTAEITTTKRNSIIGGARPLFSFVGLWNLANDAPVFEAINADIDAAAAEQPKDSPAGAREVGRQLVARNRDSSSRSTRKVS